MPSGADSLKPNIVAPYITFDYEFSWTAYNGRITHCTESLKGGDVEPVLRRKDPKSVMPPELASAPNPAPCQESYKDGIADDMSLSHDSIKEFCNGNRS